MRSSLRNGRNRPVGMKAGQEIVVLILPTTACYSREHPSLLQCIYVHLGCADIESARSFCTLPLNLFPNSPYTGLVSPLPPARTIGSQAGRTSSKGTGQARGTPAAASRSLHLCLHARAPRLPSTAVCEQLWQPQVSSRRRTRRATALRLQAAAATTMHGSTRLSRWTK